MPVVLTVNILEDADDLGNLLIPKYDGKQSSSATLTTPFFPLDITGKTLNIAVNDGTITGTESLHKDTTNVNFQTTNASATIVIVMTFADSGTHDVEIIEDTTVDLGTGTTQLDLSGVVTSTTLDLYTTAPISFTNASRFITIKINSGGNITAATAYVAE